MRAGKPKQPLGWRDHYEIALSVAMVPLGAIIIWRSHLRVPLAIAVGIGFLAVALYRLTFVWRYFSNHKGGKA